MRAATDVLAEFQAVAAATGIPIEHVVADGRLHRVPVAGDRPGERTGWYVFHLDDRPAGAFGDWRRGVSATWSPEAPPQPLSRRELREIRLRAQEQRAVRQRERERVQSEIAEHATGMWRRASAADPAHPYLISHGIRVGIARQWRDSLVLPVTDIHTRAVVSLQYIRPDGAKRYLTGGRIRGCVIPVRMLPGDPQARAAATLLLCEGWATGMALAEIEPGTIVMAATSAGNLEPAAISIRRRWRGTMVIAGDADPVGREKAHSAARKVGASVAIPELQPGSGTDWCDWWLLQRQGGSA